MSLETLANIGDFVGGLAVIVSLLYLAVQIRQNTRAIRSSSYHQAAEQTWNYCLAVAQDASLAELLVRRGAGSPLDAAEQARAASADHALFFGLENMLRLHEQGLVDRDIWENLLANTMFFLTSKTGKELLALRQGPLSQRLLAEVEARPHLHPPPLANEGAG